MAKSFVYFSAGVSGESRPPPFALALARATTDVDYVVTLVVAQCNIVYEKDPANVRARAVDATAACDRCRCCTLHRRAEKMGRLRAAWL